MDEDMTYTLNKPTPHAHRCPRCHEITLVREWCKSRRPPGECILERCTRCKFWRILAAEVGEVELTSRKRLK